MYEYSPGKVQCSVKIDDVELGVGCGSSKFLAKKEAVEATVKILKSLYPVIIEKEDRNPSKMVFHIYTDEDADERISQEIASFSTSNHQLDKLVFVGFEEKRECINLLSFYAHVKAKSHRETGVIELTKERDYVCSHIQRTLVM